MKLQDNVRAVVVKEVQLRDPVTRSKRVRCTAAPAPAQAPVALPSTAHCPASGDHPPTPTRPPLTRTAIRAAAARQPTDYGARARRPQRGQHQQGLRSERRAARRPTDYRARARAGGTCLVAVLHAASVIVCWGRAAGLFRDEIIYYGARARAGGTCLVAVLHAASVIGCWGRAAGAASVIVCW